MNIRATRLALIPGAVLAASGSAMAAVPAAVTTAVEGIATDGGSIATAVLLAVVAIFAIKFLRRAF